MFRFILFILALYLIFKASVRWLFPWLVKRYMDKVKRNYQQTNPGYNEQKPNEGAVHIKHTTGNKRTPNANNVGEYIDFEEVKE